MRFDGRFHILQSKRIFLTEFFNSLNRHLNRSVDKLLQWTGRQHGNFRVAAVEWNENTCGITFANATALTINNSD